MCVVFLVYNTVFLRTLFLKSSVYFIKTVIPVYSSIFSVYFSIYCILFRIFPFIGPCGQMDTDSGRGHWTLTKTGV